MRARELAAKARRDMRLVAAQFPNRDAFFDAVAHGDLKRAWARKFFYGSVTNPTAKQLDALLDNLDHLTTS